MGEASTVGIDLAKSVFQVHGAAPSGAVLVRKKLRRDQVLAFFAALPRCVVAMEACASAHYWAREIAALGHDTRLIPPAYVKPNAQETEERHGRRGGDLRGGAAPDDAVRSGQECTGAGRGRGVPHPRHPRSAMSCARVSGTSASWSRSSATRPPTFRRRRDRYWSSSQIA